MRVVRVESMLIVGLAYFEWRVLVGWSGGPLVPERSEWFQAFALSVRLQLDKLKGATEIDSHLASLLSNGSSLQSGSQEPWKLS